MSETHAEDRRSFFSTQSRRLPSSHGVRVMRLWLPAVLVTAGIVLLIVKHFDGFGVSAFAGFVGAGLSIMLADILWRIGVSGDEERDVETEARRYLAEHGHWPDQDERS